MAAKKAAKRAASRKATAKKGTRKASTKKSAKKAVKRTVRPSPAASGTKAAARPDKGEGAKAMHAAIAKLRAEHRAMAETLDAIVAREVPDAKRAVKWGSPMWGVEGKGWFMAFGSFKNYGKVNFFNGVELKPAPPEGDAESMRSINVPSLKELDERQLASWVKQAAARPGWGKA